MFMDKVKNFCDQCSFGQKSLNHLLLRLISTLIKLERGYGQTGSKAHLPAFFQFSTEFIEIFRKCFSFQGSLNDAIKSDLTLLYSAHFALGSAHFALFFRLF
jgi:hypothetical protein